MNKKYAGFASPFDSTQVDKAEALATAKKFQKPLLLSKAVYPYVVLVTCVVLGAKNLHLPISDGVVWWLSGTVAVWIIYSIFSTLILGICPYCQQFQKPNGQTLGVDAQSVLVKLRRTLLSENFHTPMGSSHCWLYAAV